MSALLRTLRTSTSTVARNMSSTWSHTRVAASTSSSPFTRAVVDSMRALYPESLADKSFDNTGLLLEAPVADGEGSGGRDKVLLTIDLTNAVADEALQGGFGVVVSYHPIIFRGLKSLTLADTQQRSLLRLAAKGISVYCPHTAVDAAEGGLGDWLADIVSGSVASSSAASTHASTSLATPSGALLTGPGLPKYTLHEYATTAHNESESESGFNPATHPHTRTPITPHPSSSKTTGMGRLVTLTPPRPLGAILSALAAALSHPRAFHIALPASLRTSSSSFSSSSTLRDHAIHTVAICAGSGAGVFASLAQPADLLLTGEMGHHEALAATERGSVAVTLLHSNSERGFLSGVMKKALEAGLAERGWDGERVRVSEADGDPFAWAVLDA